MNFSPRLVIFDKDGTLIDFHLMWGEWIAVLGRRLDSQTGLTISPLLFHAFGFDPLSHRVAPDGPLALWSLADLRQLAFDVLVEAGLERADGERVVSQVWSAPDPVQRVRPLADLRGLFMRLRSSGVQIGIATIDDRAATEATIRGLGIAKYVDAIVCGDDGLPPKPAPDMVLNLCGRLGVGPGQTVVVGDAIADLEMGRSAGVGLVVGVLSGVSSRKILEPHAQVLIASVGELV